MNREKPEFRVELEDRTTFLKTVRFVEAQEQEEAIRKALEITPGKHLKVLSVERIWE